MCRQQPRHSCRPLRNGLAAQSRKRASVRLTFLNRKSESSIFLPQSAHSDEIAAHLERIFLIHSIHSHLYERQEQRDDLLFDCAAEGQARRCAGSLLHFNGTGGLGALSTPVWTASSAKDWDPDFQSTQACTPIELFAVAFEPGAVCGLVTGIRKTLIPDCTTSCADG
jgi:hypothetical protein